MFDTSELTSITQKEIIKDRYTYNEIQHVNRTFPLEGNYADFNETLYPHGFVFYDFEVFKWDWLVVLIDPIERTNYGYYKIPFFYYGFYQRQNGGAYVNMTPEGLDPARHFPVYGGYDEVIYGKPWPGPEGFYIDDRAIRPKEFIENDIGDLTKICNTDKEIA